MEYKYKPIEKIVVEDKRTLQERLDDFKKQINEQINNNKSS